MSTRNLNKKYHPSRQYIFLVLKQSIEQVGYFFEEMFDCFEVRSVTCEDTGSVFYHVVSAPVASSSGGMLKTYHDIKKRINYRIAGNKDSRCLYRVGYKNTKYYEDKPSGLSYDDYQDVWHEPYVPGQVIE